MDIIFAWDVPDNPLPPGPFPPTKSAAGFYLPLLFFMLTLFLGGLSFVTGKVVTTKTDLFEAVAVVAEARAGGTVFAIVTSVIGSLMSGKGIARPLGMTGGENAEGDTTIWALVQVQEVGGTTGITMDTDLRMDLLTTH